MFDQVGGLSREEVAGMIERATSNFLKTMKGEHTVSPCIGVFVVGFVLVFVCVLVFVFVLTMFEHHYKIPLDHLNLLLWVLGISGCSLLKGS